jgi:hypothetical protein
MNDQLEKYFENNKNSFDIEEPSFDHLNRFEYKLRNVKKTKVRNIQKWPFLAVAASIVLFIGIGIGSNFSSNNLELADVSPKMEETQNYFSAVIIQELEKVTAQKTTYNQHVINDALEQLKILENNYTKLTFELYESHEDQRIIFAMISNFQQRIQLLETLLNQLDKINQLKSKNYENHV